MSDYIKREDVIETVYKLREYFKCWDRNDDIAIKKYLNAIPAADVRENVRGEWLSKNLDNFRKYEVICSVCGARFIGNYDAYDEPYDFNFCPNCGAEMENSFAMNKKTKAKWVCLGHKMGFCKHPYSVDYKCSNCGYEEYTLLSSPPDKCPNCGAEMQGEGR